MTDDRVAQLEALYAGLPTIKCQGLCWNSCGPIMMSDLERERIEAAGVRIPDFDQGQAVRWNRGEPLHCPALDGWHRCTVYDVRPMICRIWGVGRGDLACPHGCEREGPRLRLGEVLQLVLKANVIGGNDDEWDWSEIDEQVMQDPAVKSALIRHMSGEDTAAVDLMNATQRARERLREGVE